MIVCSLVVLMTLIEDQKKITKILSREISVNFIHCHQDIFPEIFPDNDSPQTVLFNNTSLNKLAGLQNYNNNASGIDGNT